MTTGDSNDKVAAILDDAYGHAVSTEAALMAMAVIELKRIADHLAAISESGPR